MAARIMNPAEPNILVGIDFSIDSERALATAAALAKRLGVSLQVVHIFEPLVAVALDPARIYSAIETCIQEERLHQRKLCAELCERVVGNRVRYTVQVFDAMALDGLLEAIAKFKPELVVVGSHGRGAIQRMLVGSVSASLCRRSSVPVLVVPTAEQASASS